MKVIVKKSITGLILILNLVVSDLWAQSDIEMADTMRSEGKIYVVVGIVLIVLAGLILYLFLLDRKIGKIEKRLK